MNKQPFHPRVIYGFVMLVVVAIMSISGFPFKGTLPGRFGHRFNAATLPGVSACIAVFLLYTGWREMNKRR